MSFSDLYQRRRIFDGFGQLQILFVDFGKVPKLLCESWSILLNLMQARKTFAFVTQGNLPGRKLRRQRCQQALGHSGPAGHFDRFSNVVCTAGAGGWISLRPSR